ncbi:MAG TPA: hypothetical protein VML75_12175 [Kofleriaceae bacterium]|nr:hypothetical protein [Kofleriaceae bacterium]
MRRLWLAATLAAACASDPDPCEGVDGRCLAVRVTSATVERIDQLELDLLYGGYHDTLTLQADGGRVVSLPVTTAISIDGADPIAIGVVAAGKLSGLVLGTGAASATLQVGTHGAIEIELADTQDCVAGGLYCGGDKLAGDPDTLYQCNGGGVPLARGVCDFGCLVRPAADDTCRGGGGTCVEGGFYCGGDKLDGDPQTLYRCAGGTGTDGVECADGCVVAPPGMDDFCR